MCKACETDKPEVDFGKVTKAMHKYYMDHFEEQSLHEKLIILHVQLNRIEKLLEDKNLNHESTKITYTK